MKLSIKTDLVGDKYEFYIYDTEDYLGFIKTSFYHSQLLQIQELKTLDQNAILAKI